MRIEPVPILLLDLVVLAAGASLFGRQAVVFLGACSRRWGPCGMRLRRMVEEEVEEDEGRGRAFDFMLAACFSHVPGLVGA